MRREKMKLCIATSDGQVAEHFGYCQEFTIFDIQDKKIVNKQAIENPGHKPGFLPNFLHQQGVTIMVSGGMGQSALNIFESHNIKVVTGLKGSVDDIAKSCIEGSLEGSSSACKD